MDEQQDLEAPEGAEHTPGGWLLPATGNGARPGWLRTPPPPPAEATDPIAAVVAEEPTQVVPVAVPANADVVPETTSTRRFHLPHLGRRTGIVLALLGGLMVMALAGAAYATYDYSQRYDGKILPGATISGVDVSGMTEEEAVRAVRAAIRPQMHDEVTLSLGEKTWEVTPRHVGARSDARAAVQAALEASSDASFFHRMRMRVFGAELDFDRPVAITYPRRGIRSFIEGLASGFDQEPQDATIDYSTGWVKIVKEEEGRRVQVAASTDTLADALNAGDDEATLAVKTEAPEVTADKYDQVLLLRIGENKLYLYEKGKITHTWTVATGQPEYPTPTGEYEVELKRYMPTWVNPDPDGWGADMPAMIPPGPGNPLGVRAINWTAPAIRFHGTSATYSLGYNASHGCVRMSNEDVIQLYDLIEVGTPIISTVVAPLKPMYASAPDPTVVAEDSGEDEPTADAGDAEQEATDDGKPGGKKGGNR